MIDAIGAESMNEPRLNHVQCLGAVGLHRMAYWEWGDADNPRVLVCMHGLSRQGRDFDVLAAALKDEWRVVCPDVVGRGESDFLSDPNGYQIPQYVADMVTLVARLGVVQVDWVGTSMGGLIGLGLAALAGTPIRRLVLNDVGPTLEPAALARIGNYLGQPVEWPTLDAAADDLWRISSAFGPHSRAQWLDLSRPMLRPLDPANLDAGFRPHYDPGIAVPLRALTKELVAAGEAALWARYDAIRCPVLLLRGAESDLLTHETAQAMTQRGPRARLHEFAGCGHAPTLVQPEQVAVVREFLRAR